MQGVPEGYWQCPPLLLLPRLGPCGSKIISALRVFGADQRPCCKCVLFCCSFSVPAVPLYGYGARENDREYVERKVDFNSPLFKPETGFPFGNTLRSSLYVSLLWLDLLLGKRPSPKNLWEGPGARCL